MRRIGVAAILLGLFCLPAGAQIGKSIIVPAGTPADKALYAITAAADPAQKISLINQFMSNYGSKPDMALLANILLTKACLDAKEYDKAMEAGDKVLASDPDNFSTAVNLVEAAAAKADASRAFDYGEKAAGIMARYKSSPPPAGMSREGWAGQQGDTLKAVQPDFEAMQYLLLKTASGVSDSATRAALLERFLKTFPDSAYAPNATVSLAFAYQQSQNVARMLEVSQAILAKDPSNVSILLLLADYYSSAGKQLEDATSDAQKVLGILSTAKKPAEMSDDAWMKQVDLQKGIANSALGQVAITRGRASEAAKYFEDANPLLQPNDFYYARNLYRLGFTLAKLERFPEARKYLEEAIKIDSPFRTLAQQTLDTVNGGGPAPRKSRHP